MSLNQDNSTRKKILSAGIKVFAEKGYKDATVREICKEAGSANINSINYYFRSKERLYREILEIIFADDKFDLQDWEQKSPQEQFKEMILNFCRLLYKNNALSSDITAIFVNEMTRPSPFLVDLVDQYNRPRVKRHLVMFKGLLGEDASDDMARDCLVSVSGQLLYYSFAWPVFSRLFPDYSADKRYEIWAEHVFEFSMGGIASLKEKLQKKRKDPMEIEFSLKYFISQAMGKTGLEDFGGQTFEKGLGALIYSLNNDIDLNEGTAAYFQNQILQILINRLEVIQLVKDHPEILEEKIKKPIFIVGLPRSGTTILHTLMALDPTSRYLRNFESTGPICPPPELIPDSVDRRIQACHEGMENIFSTAPVLRGINGINFMAHGTAECQNLMAHEFVHMGWSSGSSLFSHGNWVSECNMKTAFQWHRLLLQVLQWKLPNERWVLKAPMHLFGLNHLMETYPDAKIVFTHRNPFDAIVSGVSMVYHWTQFSTGQADIQAIAGWYSKLWAKGLRRALKTIKTFNADQILDIFHHDLSESSVKMVGRIYDRFDIMLSKGTLNRMQIWLRGNPRSKFGRHDHTRFIKDHLNSAKERERFRFYCDQFDL